MSVPVGKTGAKPGQQRCETDQLSHGQNTTEKKVRAEQVGGTVFLNGTGGSNPLLYYYFKTFSVKLCYGNPRGSDIAGGVCKVGLKLNEQTKPESFHTHQP